MHRGSPLTVRMRCVATSLFCGVFPQVTEEDEVDDKSSAAERGRFVPLFFALCTKKHDLLGE